MKKYKNFVIGGIQQKVFNLALYVILLMMAAFTAVLIFQYNKLTKVVKENSDQQKNAISWSSSATMDAVLTSSLQQGVIREAQIADHIFSSVAKDVAQMADFAGRLFAEPGSFSPHPYALPDKALEGTACVQLLTEEGVDTSQPAVAEQLGLIANMSDMMTSLFSVSEISDCYIALPSGVMLLADDHPASKYQADGSLTTFQMTKRPWYIGAINSAGLYFTDVEQDVFTGNISIMCSMPVFVGGELKAVVGADLFLDSMQTAIRDAAQNNGFLFVINQNGHVVFSPKESGTLQVKTADNAPDLRQSPNVDLATLVRSTLAGITKLQTVEVDGEVYYMAGAPVETSGWAVFSCVDKALTDQPTLNMLQQYDTIAQASTAQVQNDLKNGRTMILILIGLVALLGGGAALYLAKRLVKPLNIMTERVLTLGGDNLRFNMEKAYKTGDEIEVLAEAFSMLSAKTLEYVDTVRTVTAEKERIGAELSMATAIQNSQLPRLFPPFPNLTEFDLYASMTPAKEVGGDFYDFFLVDEDHIALVMADVSGKGVPAALFMMVSRVLIKSRLQAGESPAEALSHVNDQLCESNDAELFVTVWLGVLQISTGKGVAANAGHEHPALRRKGEDYGLQVYRHSPAVATMPGMVFRQHEFELHPGDSLFVYTDGVAEATSAEKELFGADRMLDALNRDPDAPPREVLKNVMEGINAFVGEAEQFDDITMLSLQYYGPGGKKE